jgi:quinol monooxygenase YgiN
MCIFTKRFGFRHVGTLAVLALIAGCAEPTSSDANDVPASNEVAAPSQAPKAPNAGKSASTPTPAKPSGADAGTPSDAGTIARVGLLVRVEAKPGSEGDVEALLRSGAMAVADEQGTPYWFGIKIGPSTFGIFDAFPDSQAREAHLAGKLAAAIMQNAPFVLAQAPTIEPVDVIAKKDTWRPTKDAQIDVGLLVRLEAQQGKEAVVQKLLQDGASIVAEESSTPLWFAIKLGPSTFGIFDAFTDASARQAHLEGRLAQALVANAPSVLASPPSIEPVDVLGTKLPH